LRPWRSTPPSHQHAGRATEWSGAHLAPRRPREVLQAAPSSRVDRVRAVEDRPPHGLVRIRIDIRTAVLVMTTGVHACRLHHDVFFSIHHSMNSEQRPSEAKCTSQMLLYVGWGSMYLVKPRTTAMSSVEHSTSCRNSKVPGSSLRSSYPATMASRPRHGSENGVGL